MWRWALGKRQRDEGLETGKVREDGWWWWGLGWRETVVGFREQDGEEEDIGERERESEREILQRRWSEGRLKEEEMGAGQTAEDICRRFLLLSWLSFEPHVS